MDLCLGCMEKLDNHEDICPNCGYQRDTPAKEAHLLQPGYILNNRYIIGRTLGHGGFGVAYIGWDRGLERKVAIKEYLPSDFATRMPGDDNLTVYQNEASEQFKAGLDSFLAEARRLAMFNEKPGIVDIYDTFDQNRTAYIVMQFLEGRTLKAVAQEQGLFTWEKAKDIMLQVLQSLRLVHEVGIIHRDISPDNIFLTNTNEVKLLDFGAARFATTFHSKSLSVILKPGYAPEEQYRSHGQQGSWTDVYATAATFYKVITGKRPEEAMERAIKDTVLPPSKLGIRIPKNIENALMNAMNVRIEDRTQSADEFIAELESDHVARKKQSKNGNASIRFPKFVKIAIAASAMIFLSVGVFVMVGLAQTGNGGEIPVLINEDSNEVFIPSVLNHSEEDAQKLVQSANLVFKIDGKDNSDLVTAGTVFSQNPQGGNKVLKGAEVNVTISAGPISEYIPNVCDKWEKDVTDQLTKMGFRVKSTHAFGAGAPDTIISQDFSPGTSVARNSIINLVVSKGYESLELNKETKMPEILGLSVAEAKILLLKNGLYLIVEQEQLDETVAKGCIISCNARTNDTLTTGDIVNVVISQGIKMVRVPDLQYKKLEDATIALESLELSAEVEYEVNATVVKGNVIRQATASGLEVVPNTSVKIIVSLGAEEETPSSSSVSSSSKPESSSVASKPPAKSEPPKAQNAIPYVIGYNENDAASVLADAGFSSAVKYESSNNQPKGQVISQSPAGGRSADKNSKVTITISSGPDVTVVAIDPSELIDMKVKIASGKLNKAGAIFNIEYQYTSDENENGKVFNAYIDTDGTENHYVLEVWQYQEDVEE